MNTYLHAPPSSSIGWLSGDSPHTFTVYEAVPAVDAHTDERTRSNVGRVLVLNTPPANSITSGITARSSGGVGGRLAL